MVGPGSCSPSLQLKPKPQTLNHKPLPYRILAFSGQGGAWGGGSEPEKPGRPFNQKRFEWFQACMERKKKKKEELRKKREKKDKKGKK